MLRSAAKNHKYTCVLSSPSQYPLFIQELRANNGATSLSVRRQLAAQAFSTSALYDANIASYFNQSPEVQSTSSNDANTAIVKTYEPMFPLKYGCNPHQQPSGVYRNPASKAPFRVVNGSPGYINLLDACNAWQLVHELRQALNLPAAASFKHCSPAGAAVAIPLTPVEAQAYDIADPSSLSPSALAYVRARNADPMSSFGDFAALSDFVDAATASVLKVEVCDGIIAPGYSPEALDILTKKKKGAFIVLEADVTYSAPTTETREIYGLCMMQRRNDVLVDSSYLQRVVITGNSSSASTTATGGDATGSTSPSSTLSPDAVRDMILSTITIKYTQSNSVGYACNGQMIGIGAGQQSRVDCVKLAASKCRVWFLRQHPKVLELPFREGVKRQEKVNAKVRYIEGDFTEVEYRKWLELFNAAPPALTEEEKRDFVGRMRDVTLSSDAFFPFRDSIDHASKVGVKYVVQPGGSVADEEVMNACREYDMTMVFTNLRLFHH
jgi:phosphoribosylaminoimidazolecarboxamide formyltransferase / IMP cyclohydrolase